MKAFVGDNYHDEDALDRRDKVKLALGLLAISPFLIAGALYSRLFYAALFAILGVAYAVLKLRLRKGKR